jgi:hypothetical protein
MNLTLTRIAKRSTYTIGKLYIDGVYFCDTIEDTDRGLTQSMPLAEIKQKKVYGETAIPTGTYSVIINYSPKFKKNMPLITGVRGFDGIRIHTGNTADDSLGCIIVGKNKVVGKVLESRDTYNKLFPILTKACKEGKIYINIQ